MPTYNFKRETKVYVVRNNLRYTIDVYPDLSFSQTFDETSVPVKTLHSQYDMFENAVITKATPANFSFTSPILYENDMQVLLDLLLDYDTTSSEATLKTADLYFEANSEVYKIENCVIESGTFQLQNASVITVSLSGSGRKLSKYVGSIPGAVVGRSGTRSFGRITSLYVSVGGVEQKSITAVTAELKNNVSWTDFATLQNSLLVSDASGTQFPGAFVVQSRTLSGTIQQYVTDETNTFTNGWATSSPITIRAGEVGKSPILQFVIPAAVFTNRLDVQEVYGQGYDFRMVSNPAALSTVIIK